MAVPMCDKHPVPAARIVSNCETGDQDFMCMECFGSTGASPAPVQTPAACEMCGEEPPAITMTNLGDGSTVTVGHRCYLVMGRTAFIEAPKADQTSVIALAKTVVAQGQENAGETVEQPPAEGGEQASAPALSVVGDEQPAGDTAEQRAGDEATPTPEPVA